MSLEPPGPEVHELDGSGQRLPPPAATDRPARPVLPWILAGALAVAALVVVLIVGQGSDRATPGPDRPAAASDRTPIDGLGDGAVTDLAATDSALYLLQPAAARIAVVPLGTHTATGFTPVPAGVSGMAMDADGSRVWLYWAGRDTTVVRLYELTDTGAVAAAPTATARVTIPSPVTGVVALQDRLYLNGSTAPREVRSDGARLTTRVLALRGADSAAIDFAAVDDLVAQPTGQLLALTRDAAGRDTVWTLDPTGDDVFHHLLTVTLDGASVAPLLDGVWLVGSTAHGPGVLRVDAPGVAVMPSGGPGPFRTPGTLSAGNSVLWWRVGDRLQCVDPATLHVAQSWDLPGVENGALVTAITQVYVQTDGRVYRLLTRAACPG